MTDTPDTDEAPTDGVALLPGGRARFTIDGNVYLLRAPNMGQVRSFRAEQLDILAEARDAAVAVAERVPDEVEEIGPEGVPVEDVSDTVLGLLREANQPTAAHKALNNLGRRIVAELCQTGQQLPADDDMLPPWLANTNLYQRLRDHWMADPLAPGR